jgi:carbon storage regulator
VLVLTRKPQQAIMLDIPGGDQIKVVVLGVKGSQVQLGIEASRDVKIAREELLAKKEGQ